MTWIKLEDEVADHPKIAGLSDRAFRWWIRSLCYCSRFLTDGAIPAVFLIGVKPNIRAELIAARLWIETDSRVEIHDYLRYQTSRNAVEKERERNRDRRSGGGRTAGTTDGTTDGTTNGTTAGTTGGKPRPDTEDRRQKTDTETTPSLRGGGLIPSPAQVHRLLQTHAFVGVFLRVPNVLHSELVSKSGASSDGPLRDWYQELDAELEAAGKGTGDVFAWLRPRHQAFAVSKGWIDAAPTPAKPAQKTFSVVEAIAREAARRAAAK